MCTFSTAITKAKFYSRFYDFKQWTIHVVRLTWLRFACTCLMSLCWAAAAAKGLALYNTGTSTRKYIYRANLFLPLAAISCPCLAFIIFYNQPLHISEVLALDVRSSDSIVVNHNKLCSAVRCHSILICHNNKCLGEDSNLHR
jgi:hypothetical protein